jgi:hypothetical protein
MRCDAMRCADEKTRRWSFEENRCTSASWWSQGRRVMGRYKIKYNNNKNHLKRQKTCK